MASPDSAQSRCRVELRAKYDSGRIAPLYDWYATCSCGWRGPERAHEVDATGDGHEHAPRKLTGREAAPATLIPDVMHGGTVVEGDLIEDDDPICGRVLVGQGDDTYDPLCVLPPGHARPCEPEKP